MPETSEIAERRSSERRLPWILVLGAIIAGGLGLWLVRGTTSPSSVATHTPDAGDRTADPGRPAEVAAAPPQPAADELLDPLPAAPEADEAMDGLPDYEGYAGSRYPEFRDIEAIKEAIYALEIDSLERVHLLDGVVQTGDTDTRTLWDADWGGVDDWKDDANGFTLQRDGDGTLIFHPDEGTARLYSFLEFVEPYEHDPQSGEFVSQVDYYGKPVFNVLKFINDEAVVMMTISGKKVDLNIYGRSLPGE